MCLNCALHTQRYVGLLSGSNRTACQCKEGASMACLFGLVSHCLEPMELLSSSSRAWRCRLLPSRRPGWRGAPPQIGVRFIIVPRPSAVGFVCRRAKHVCQSFHLPPSHSLRLFPCSGAGSCGLSISDRCLSGLPSFSSLSTLLFPLWSGFRRTASQWGV